MKTEIFTTLMLLMLTQLTVAQCQANAGGNIHVCKGMYTTTATLGGTPTASGGTPSYTYCWSTNSMGFLASTLLNDTTLANPTLTANIAVPVNFYLKVTDALGCVSYDTCKVTFSQFTYGLGYATVYIDQNMINNGDSITINLMTVSGSSYTPYTYSWSPAYGLGTTTLATWFQALPAVSTVYSVTVTDNKGCKSKPTAVYYVFVCPAGQVVDAFGFSCVPGGIHETSVNKINLSVYPNPASNKATIELPQSGIYAIKLSNLLGSACQEISSAGEKSEIDLSQLNKGIYFLQVFEKGKLVAVEKFIKE
jgi:hypothetical protein